MKRILLFTLFLLAFGAKSFASDTICVGDIPVDLKFTNVITPNNDGYNDVFKVESKNLSDLHIKIYDRWGALVYSYAGINGSWDGTSFGSVLSDGVYYYVVNYSTTCKPGATTTTGGYIQIIGNTSY